MCWWLYRYSALLKRGVLGLNFGFTDTRLSSVTFIAFTPLFCSSCTVCGARTTICVAECLKNDVHMVYAFSTHFTLDSLVFSCSVRIHSSLCRFSENKNRCRKKKHEAGRFLHGCSLRTYAVCCVFLLVHYLFVENCLLHK